MRAAVFVLVVAAPLSGEPWVSYVARSGPGFQWRALDAAEGTELVLAELPQAPRNVFWTADWTRVYFRLDEKVYSMEWRRGAEPRVEADIPPAIVKDLHEVWLDSATSRLMLSTMTADPKAPPVVIGAPYWARILERDPATSRWTRVVQEPTAWDAGETLGPLVLRKHIRTAVHSTEASTLGGGYLSLRKEIEWLSGERDGEGDVLLHISGSTRQGLQMRVEWGDLPHFFAPVRYGRRGRTSREVFGVRRCSRQVVVVRRDDWALVGDERSCACPVLVNLRDGRARDLGLGTVLASWVEPPR